MDFIYYLKKAKKENMLLGSDSAGNKSKDAELDPVQEAVKNSLVVYIKKNKDNYDIKYAGEEEVSGRRTYHLSTVLKADARQTVNLWSDIETGILVKVEMKSKHKVIMMYLTKIELNPVFKDNIFKLNLPKDIELVKQ